MTVSFQLDPSLCLNKYLLFENEEATISLEGDFTDLMCLYLIIFFPELHTHKCNTFGL